MAKPRWPSERRFDKEAIDLALSYAPPIHQCAECGHPAIKGYCCPSCGNGEEFYDDYRAPAKRAQKKVRNG